jgi:transmembrane sensor
MRKARSSRRERFSALRETARAIDSRASDWVVRIDRGLTQGERRALENWLESDERHQGALARAQAFWVDAERARVFRRHGRPRDSLARKLRPTPLGWLAAACVVLGVATALYGLSRYTRTDIAAATDQIVHVQLGDGSRVTLQKGSRVSVEYRLLKRLVRLESGDALFEVAKNSYRPFIVEAGDVRVRAVGTAFDVDRWSDSTVDVLVTKGTVDVWRRSKSSDAPLRLVAGNRLHITPQGMGTPTEAQFADAPSAPVDTPVIEFNGLTLGQAAAEFNRHNRQTVVITDPGIAAQPVVGRFQASDPAAFVTAAAAMLDAHVRRDDERLILEAGPHHQKNKAVGEAGSGPQPPLR